MLSTFVSDPRAARRETKYERNRSWRHDVSQTDMGAPRRRVGLTLNTIARAGTSRLQQDIVSRAPGNQKGVPSKPIIPPRDDASVLSFSPRTLPHRSLGARPQRGPLPHRTTPGRESYRVSEGERPQTEARTVAPPPLRRDGDAGKAPRRGPRPKDTP